MLGVIVYALNEETGAFAVFLEYSYFGDFGMTGGVFAPLWCRERLPFLRADVLAGEIEAHGICSSIWSDLDDESFCEIWDIAPADATELEPVESDIPTLLVSGA